MKSLTLLTVMSLLTLSLFGCKLTNPTLREKAIQAKQRGDVDRAVQLYNKALDQDDTDWRAMTYLAIIQYERQQWIEAQHSFEKVISLQPAHPKVPIWLDRVAECLFQQGRAQALRDTLLNANEQYGTSHDFLRQANYLTKLGDMDQAHVAYRKAVHFADKNDADPWIAMAAFYELIGDKANAIDALRHAHAIDPENLSVADRLRHYGIVPGPTAGVYPKPVLPPLPDTEVAAPVTQDAAQEATPETAPQQ
ncbi:MAG: hypothetical protein CMJ19_00325 [Phycisphaeraceae bacterium]|nr:hypothetical protein [Phycisphaeraceae bacterium]